MSFARKLLYPFSLLYGGITAVRNTLYDTQLLKSHSYDLPVICVGNLSVGGTGKSPMVEYLINLLKDEFRVATLSRGYKRSSSGFLLLTGNDKASETGDEPLQFKTKFPGVQVAVDESRSHGIEQLLGLEPVPEVILLDDAFQHRKISAGLNILLTPYNNLYADDLILPAGNLREPVGGAKRAGIVVVTKCPPGLDGEEKNRIEKKLKLKKNQELFFTSVDYAPAAKNAKGTKDLESFSTESFALVTGIANPKPLVEHLQKLGLKFKHLDYPDHHNFSAAELEEINNQDLVLTTEKDFMRLKNSIGAEKLYYLPIRIHFLKKAKSFNALVKNYCKKNETF